MNHSALLEPRRRPRQKRSQALVRAIKDACLKILQEQGADKLTTHHIAEVAGVTVGSLYQYFPNKDVILAEVYREKAEADATDILSRGRQTLVRGSLQDKLRNLVRLKVESQLRYLHLHQAFYRKYRDVVDFQPIVDQTSKQALRQPTGDEWFEALLRYHHSEIQVDDIEAAAFIAGRALDRVIESAVEEHPEWLEQASFQQRLMQLLNGYLSPVDSAID